MAAPPQQAAIASSRETTLVCSGAASAWPREGRSLNRAPQAAIAHRTLRRPLHAGITLRIPDFQVEANRHRRPVRNDRYTGARKV